MKRAAECQANAVIRKQSKTIYKPEDLGTRVKSLIKKMLPVSTFRFLARSRAKVILGKEAGIDAWRFARFAGPPDNGLSTRLSAVNIEAQLTKDAHRIEKGLALGAPRRPFGLAVGARLTELLEISSKSSSPSPRIRDEAQTALEALDHWNAEGVVEKEIAPQGEELRAQDIADLRSFFASRRSLRNYDPLRLVDKSDVDLAIELASNTPSVCNRQSARLHIYQGQQQVSELLRHQNGNSGFGADVSNLAVVSVECGLFAGPGERNQRWIDGGLFAMSFVWALHGMGVHSCMLNWSMTNKASNNLRKDGNIPASEDIICLVAFGYPTDGGYRIARSVRRPVTEIVRHH